MHSQPGWRDDYRKIADGHDGVDPRYPRYPQYVVPDGDRPYQALTPAAVSVINRNPPVAPGLGPALVLCSRGQAGPTFTSRAKEKREVQ